MRPATGCPCLLLGWCWPAPLLLRPLWQLWPPPLWRPRWLLRPLWLPGPGLPPLPPWRLLPLPPPPLAALWRGAPSWRVASGALCPTSAALSACGASVLMPLMGS